MMINIVFNYLLEQCLLFILIKDFSIKLFKFNFCIDYLPYNVNTIKYYIFKDGYLLIYNINCAILSMNTYILQLDQRTSRSRRGRDRMCWIYNYM